MTLRIGERNLLKHAADIVIQLKADGTYEILKDRKQDHGPRDEEVYGVRSFNKIEIH